MDLVVNYATALLANAILFFLTPHEKILSGGRRAVDDVIGREHFNRFGNALLGGRGVAVVEGIISGAANCQKNFAR